MNIAALPKPRVTRAADGLDRHVFTVAEVLQMEKAGILEGNYELLEGEIVPMQAKNYPHERIKLALVRLLSRALPDDLQLGVETSIYLSDITFVEPDLSIFPMMNTEQVRGESVLLAIEVADTTLRKDRGLKAAIYAKYGVRELWVIDANKLVTYVYRQPVNEGWAEMFEVKADGELAFTASGKTYSVRLSDL